ncbi:MAG: hypothetical protein L6V79_04630 [Clostridium sp.]|nr:MAG: hypothetical protein L6V79_04630 [Clostridium sp.]
MNFNPLMLLPLIMGGKNGGDADMTKMLEMMNVLKDGNPDALLNALPVDDKTKNRAEYGERIKRRKSKRGDRRTRRLCRPARKTPSRRTNFRRGHKSRAQRAYERRRRQALNAAILEICGATYRKTLNSR